MNARVALQLTGVERHYGQGETVLSILKGADFSLRSGETVALVAPSGTGKATLLHIAGLLERPDAGEVKINGVDVPSHEFEELLKHWYTSIERQIAEEKDVLELRETVKNQAEEMLRNKMNELVNKMLDLDHHIDRLLED